MNGEEACKVDTSESYEAPDVIASYTIEELQRDCTLLAYG
jgi:hypothetical protein